MKKLIAVVLVLVIITIGLVPLFKSNAYETAEAEDNKTKIDFRYNVYYGFLHNHSAMSDGSGTPMEAYTYAREKAKLDFFSLADHDGPLGTESWKTIQTAARESARLGEFVTFWGYEWSSGRWGHVTVINSNDVFKCSGKTFTDLLEWLKGKDVLAILNHPGRQDGGKCEFNHFKDPPLDNVIGMELWNKSRGFSRWYYNDGYYKNDGGMSYYDEANARGWRIGAAGSDDNHDATWGTRNDFRMGVLAENLTDKDITRALKARRFFSTLDKNLKLYFRCDDKEMGSVLEPGTYEIETGMSDDNKEIFTKVELNKNGKVIKTWKPKSEKPIIVDTVECQDNDFIYVIVTQKDKDQAISSPIFFRKKTGEGDGKAERGKGK